MKKFFSLCTAVSVMLTGLVSCGGGGDDNPGFVTAEEFKAGMGFKLMGNPQLEIVAGYTSEVNGQRPSDSSGNTATPEITIPGTEQEEQPKTEDQDGNRYVPPTKLDPVGSMAVVKRTIKAGGSNIGDFVVTYVMTAQDIGVATFSAPGAKILSNPDLLTGLGIAVETNNNNNWNNNNNQNTLNRIQVSDLSACSIKIYFNFTNGQANVVISATGVAIADDDDNPNNGGGFTPEEVVLTAYSVDFLVTN